MCSSSYFAHWQTAVVWDWIQRAFKFNRIYRQMAQHRHVLIAAELKHTHTRGRSNNLYLNRQHLLARLTDKESPVIMSVYQKAKTERSFHSSEKNQTNTIFSSFQTRFSRKETKCDHSQTPILEQLFLWNLALSQRLQSSVSHTIIMINKIYKVILP